MAHLRRAAAAAALALALAVAAAGSATAAPRVTRDMYGDRYCEYLGIRGAPPNLTADVWNTYGLNSCPDAQWRASDPAALASELGASAVVLNGPRNWLIDRNSIELAPGLGEIRVFSSGLRMRHVASVDVPPDRAPYRETVVRRSNTFTWTRERPVYELVAPNGRVYVMQTYSRIVDPNLRVAQLHRPGRRLDLPAGWRFRMRFIRRALSLTTRDRAIVVQDELQNTYQLRR